MSFTISLPSNLAKIVSECLLAQVIKFLTVPRAVDANRMELFAYAECFGIMVHLLLTLLTHQHI